MLYRPLISSTLLHRNLTFVPQTFRRYKSLTAAIERGRQERLEHSSRFRTRTADDSGRTRKRDDRFGTNSSRPNNDRERPMKNGYGEGLRPRESRFSRGDRKSSQYRDSTRPRDGFRPRDAPPRRQGAWQSSETDYDARRRVPREGDRPGSQSNSTRSIATGDERLRPSERRTFRDDQPLDRPRRRDDRPYDRKNRRDGQTPGTTPEANTAAPTKTIRGPETLPYSTAASEFIYGHSSVLAAIRAGRRQFYTLYVHSRGAAREGLMMRVREQKLFSITKEVGDEYLPAMDRASSGRPHNGVILEASPLPVPPITEIKAASISEGTFQVSVDSQSAEDVLVNKEQEVYSYKSGGWRYPLILYVDGVLDEGNLGAIARSAYFLGVDAIATPTRQTAPWSHIALKASAGAAEAIPIFKIGDPTAFLGKSSRAGWRIYASDAIQPAPSTSATPDDRNDGGRKVVYTIARSTKHLEMDHSPVAEHPTILMMGAEGQGLRSSLLNLAHYKVGIPHGREQNQVGVDSLNVSVAASILCYEMLQKPQPKPVGSSDETLF